MRVPPLTPNAPSAAWLRAGFSTSLRDLTSWRSPSLLGRPRRVAADGFVGAVLNEEPPCRDEGVSRRCVLGWVHFTRLAVTTSAARRTRCPVGAEPRVHAERPPRSTRPAQARGTHGIRTARRLTGPRRGQPRAQGGGDRAAASGCERTPDHTQRTTGPTAHDGCIMAGCINRRGSQRDEHGKP